VAKKHEVVIIGGGHNGLTVACYLAKAGVDVCVLESTPDVGGCVISPELAAPGFKTDICAIWHGFIQPNPLILNDELGLQSQFGLKYITIDSQFCVLFPDDSHINIYRDVDATCESIAKFSQHDAEAYKKFHRWGVTCLNILTHGLYNPPPPFGSMVAMLDQSEEGRAMLRALMVSALDICNEWFESPELKTALTKFAAESIISPHTKGSGIVLFLLIPLSHQYGGSIPEGGSGVLSESMERCLLHYGGTIHTNSVVENVVVSGGEATGVVLKGGEEIVATKAVISSLHAKQIPDLVGKENLPENYVTNLKNLMLSNYGAINQGYALHEAPDFIAGDDVNNCFNTEFVSTPFERYLKTYYDLEHGYTAVNIPSVTCQTRFDPTRAPEGKHTMYLFHFAPFELADGGASKWDEIREEVADGILSTVQKRTTNMSSDNIIGRAIETPLDLKRRDPATIAGDYNHLGMLMHQTNGNRYLPGWNYKTPVNKFWMCGTSCHPGGGVMGGGRAAVQPVMEEMGIDFEKIIES
jgi:phytoene dehydrogenase-like protein